MSRLRVPAPVANEVVETIVSCGGDVHECIVYVTAKTSSPRVAIGVIHPFHDATPVSTHVDGGELDRLWGLLAECGQTIVLQVHSHPGGAHHSGTDDAWPVVHRVGFPSLVLARFGRDEFRGSHLAIYQGAGQWIEPGPGQRHEYVELEGRAHEL